MISTAKCARFFQRKNVSWLFGDAEQISRSRWVAQISQISSAAKNPHKLQEWIDLTRVRDGARNFAQVDRPARAPSRAQSAPLSADPRPAFAAVAQLSPGSPPDIRSFSTRAQIEFRRPLRQLQDERLQSAQIKFQRRIVFGFRAARLLKFGIRFRPAFLSIQNYAAPERVALCEAFWSRFSGKPKRFVNFKPVMRI